MIAFRDGQSPDEEHSISKDQLKKIIKAMLAQKGATPSTHSHHSGLSPTQIEMIISHLMYTKGADSISITINKESDGYHLGLTIHDINDGDEDYDDESMYL
jgi:lambda repressor-like predicted transcriptional regulator